MTTSSPPDDDLLLAALEAAEQNLPLSAEVQARLKADAAFAADFAALQGVSALMRSDTAWGISSGVDAPPPHLLNAIVQAELAARPDAIRQAVVNADAPQGAPAAAKAWWQRLSSFVVGGGVVVGAAAALLITVQRAPSDEAMAPVALQAPQTGDFKKNSVPPGLPAGNMSAALADTTAGALEVDAPAHGDPDGIAGLVAKKADSAGSADKAVAVPSDDESPKTDAFAEASVGGDIADGTLLGSGARADIGASTGNNAHNAVDSRGKDALRRSARDGFVGDVSDDVSENAPAGRGRGFGFSDGDDLKPPPPPPPPAEERAKKEAPAPEPASKTATTAPTTTMPVAKPAPAASAPRAPAPAEPAPTLSAADEDQAPVAAPPARIISAEESRRSFLDRQRAVELKKSAKRKAVEGAKEKARYEGGKSKGSSAGPGDGDPDAIREQMARDRLLQEANGLLLTAERELGFGRFAGALDFAARAEAIAGGGLGLAPASTQVRAFVGLKRPADAARLASRLLNGNVADLQIVDGLLAGATAAEEIGDHRLAERLLTKAAAKENPDAARRAEAQRRLEVIRGNANLAPAKRAAEKNAASVDAASESP